MLIMLLCVKIVNNHYLMGLCFQMTFTEVDPHPQLCVKVIISFSFSGSSADINHVIVSTVPLVLVINITTYFIFYLIKYILHFILETCCF